MSQTRVRVKGRGKVPDILFNSEQTEGYIRSQCPGVVDEIVNRVNKGRRDFGLPPVLTVTFSAYRVKSDVHVLAEYEGGRVEKCVGQAEFKGKLRARPSVVRAAQKRVRAVTNEAVKTVRQDNVSRWKNQPPPEQCRDRVIEFSESMNRPSVIIPPVKPIGYEVKTETQPLDEALTDEEYKILAIYVWGRVQGTAQPTKNNMGDSSGGGDKSNRLPYSSLQELLNNWCHFIDGKLAEQHKETLAEIIASCMTDKHLDIAKIGKRITNSDNYFQQLGGYQGYIKSIAQCIMAYDQFQMISVYPRLSQITADDAAYSA